eukprot:GHVT01029838.1.p1 GENE.GHVT01029838.1~~GHVT01029838.1.p1  ORF type:complete len:404 (+),score=90.65 GHVT01029838.1:544-1755(+)
MLAADEAVRGALTKQKIHMHMLERIKKEQRAFQRNLARQEMLVARKQGELKDALRNLQRHMQLRHNAAAAVEDVEMEADSENVLRRSSLGALKEKIQAKQDSLKRRDDFDRWRSDVAVTAAAAATAASVTQLMACAVLERVVGHSLEKKLVEQVQRAQVTEESFQKIRRATGLTDVMDIVFRFLNRDVDQQHLQEAAEEARLKLERIREHWREVAATTTCRAAAHSPSKRRELCARYEKAEETLNQQLKKRADNREKLKRTEIQLDELARWKRRVGRGLETAGIEGAEEETSEGFLSDSLGDFSERLEKLIALLKNKIAAASTKQPVRSLPVAKGRKKRKRKRDWKKEKKKKKRKRKQRKKWKRKRKEWKKRKTRKRGVGRRRRAPHIHQTALEHHYQSSPEL